MNKEKKKEEKAIEPVEKPEINERMVADNSMIVEDDTENSMLMDSARFNQLWRVASAFSRSDLVPEHFRGKPENCMISISMAIRMGVDPLMMLQNSYIVYGRPGIEAKLAIALVNRSGLFTTPIQFKMSGEGKKRACTAYATLAATGAVLEETVSIEMAVAEGWTKKNGSKWLTLPDLMLKYRSAMFFSRLYCPEVLMGMQTIDELYDVGPQPESIDITPGRDEKPEPEVIDTEPDKPKKKAEPKQEPKEEVIEGDFQDMGNEADGPGY